MANLLTSPRPIEGHVESFAVDTYRTKTVTRLKKGPQAGNVLLL
jgi:hypothetical protein